MKLTKEHLQKLIKEELAVIIKEQAYQVPVDQFDQYPPKPDPSDATSVQASQQIEVNKLISAIEDGLAKKGIGLREEIKITNIRRYKGSGTGYTVEIEVAHLATDRRAPHVLEPEFPPGSYIPKDTEWNKEKSIKARLRDITGAP